ncbi:MAG: toprim domain-containing protein [Erysipelotrichaceae bacterium]|nr:toprim domain-containing protein [Erysipelotrichaceae bacterium]
MYDIDSINKCLTNENVENILTTLGVEYKKENGWIAVNCPFHENADGYNCKWRGSSWYCFSQCHKNYSMYDYVGKILDLGFIESVQWVSGILGLSDEKLRLDSSKMAQKAKIQHMKNMVKIKRKTKQKCKPVSQTVMNDIEDYIHPYILQQGFKEPTLKHFGIGYARNGELANRIVIPIDAKDGTIISLSGRAVNDEIEPKYHVIGDTEKSMTLYNISRIDPDDDYIILVEGFKSVWSLYENGFKSVVATMGSSISDEQVKLLLSLGRKVIVIGDNDKAGKRLNQAVYNRLYKFIEVVKIDMSDFTDIEKASPCDLDFEDMDELIEVIEYEIG